jgi:hypothetical protein
VVVAVARARELMVPVVLVAVGLEETRLSLEP